MCTIELNIYLHEKLLFYYITLASHNYAFDIIMWMSGCLNTFVTLRTITCRDIYTWTIVFIEQKHLKDRESVVFNMLEADL